MKLGIFDRILLTTIAIFLAILALRPLMTPTPVAAQRETHSFYIEPGTTMLHSPAKDKHVFGKVLVDLDTGKIWGLPTFVESVYPIDASKTAPPVSVPMYLGRYDFSAIDSTQ